MAKIPVVWLSLEPGTPARGYWDHGVIEELFNLNLWRVPGSYEFEHFDKDSWPESDGAIVVFPARAQTKQARLLNHLLNDRCKWVILMLTGDEESAFPFEEIKHPNMKVWVMSPRPDRHADTTFLGSGFPIGARQLLKDDEQQFIDKPLDWFFAGQITHERRQDLAEQLNNMLERPDMKGEFLPTEGFTQGMKHKEYFEKLAGAKVAPCPSGPETPDSFRIFEALEAGAVPIADTRTIKDNFPDDYWIKFFGGDVPFPVVTIYDQLPGYTLAVLEDWRAISNRVFSWWMLKKREMAQTLHDQIERLQIKAGIEPYPDMDAKDLITVVIPTSPVATHPSTEGIERTIADVRVHLPQSEIIITFDGIREQQEKYRERYEEFTRRVIWKCHHQWQNVLPVVFEKHTHQAGMMRLALEKFVKTPTVLYVEHDAPLTPDVPIDWEKAVRAVITGEANIIRFHHEAQVLGEHEHMMLGPVEEIAGGLPVRKTMQWSQRPHLASTAFYRQLINRFFNPDSKTMIEDVMHGIVQEECLHDGVMGWYNWRLWIYHPEGGNIKRSYHIDGRGADPKFEMEILPIEKGGR